MEARLARLARLKRWQKRTKMPQDVTPENKYLQSWPI
jgi:hypothetical protein